jgi:hypothetical protein
MNGEFLWSTRQRNFFFTGLAVNHHGVGCCDRPSYFVSLVSQCALRRILAAPRFNFLHSYTVERHCLERTIAGRPFVIEVTWVAEKTLARPYREDSGRPTAMMPFYGETAMRPRPSEPVARPRAPAPAADEYGIVNSTKPPVLALVITGLVLGP